MAHDDDHVLSECELEPLADLVSTLETNHSIEMIRQPSVCLTMIRAEDSLEKQEFYLGEALTTECEVSVDGEAGYGLCLGEEPLRCYCIAVLDAFLQRSGGCPTEIGNFLDRHREAIASRDKREFNLILRTQVDFKLMEEE